MKGTAATIQWGAVRRFFSRGDDPREIAEERGAPDWFGAPMALATVGIVVAVQLCVGTFGGDESFWRLDRPYASDFWYYAGLARALWIHFPPENPVFAGETLPQFNFHLAPLSVLSLAMNPYLAMRLLNVAYAGALACLLRRYFPRHYGAMAFGLLAVGPLGYRINPLSIDLATRGFHHAPFVLALLAGLFERRAAGWRAAALFAMPWFHGLMALGFGPAVLYACARSRRPVRYAGAFLGGLALAAAAVVLATDGRGGGGLLKDAGFRPVEPLIHLVPLVVGFAFVRSPLLVVMAVSSFLMACVIRFNVFYFIFPLDMALGMTAALAAAPRERAGAMATRVCGAAAFVFFVAGLATQLWGFVPYSREKVDAALDWIERKTPPRAVFLQAGTPVQVIENQEYYRREGMGYWLLEKRDIYVGYFVWAEDIGLPGMARSLASERMFKGQIDFDPIVDYIFYGPMEQALYPEFKPGPDLTAVYGDSHVTVYRVRR